ncbi:MAG: hypothetical protein GF317_05150 [Candidatus Lokiarchaeota archaeon]|nr:hypothetical protein [Candidatus Lokiarchaeota archaeon]MBD3199193.1 hypothetical protein [Candidatus Lokiarchaeota archaeon]
MSEKPSSQRKILIMGLDNAGKTSILLSLVGKKNLLTYFSLRPTEGLNIENVKLMDTTFSLWDFGGQDIYRKQYLDDFSDKIEGSDKLIYVIDVQDDQRFQTALDYLEKVIEKLVKNKYFDIDISVFLHKYDPDIKSRNLTFSEEKVGALVEQIKDVITSNFDFRLFKTTIYTTFDKTPIF